MPNDKLLGFISSLLVLERREMGCSVFEVELLIVPMDMSDASYNRTFSIGSGL